MAKTLSEDLRSRVLVAIDSGMSRRAAAERFGVGVATAVRWMHEWRTAGASCARPKGGDQRSHRIEAYRAIILAAIQAQVDTTLVELAEMLRREHHAHSRPARSGGFSTATRSPSKKQRTPASRHGQTSPRGAGCGSTASLTLVLSAWSSSTRPVLRQEWRACVGTPNAASVVVHHFRTVTGRRRSPARCGCAA